jgi:hypothetical protein
MLAGEHAGIEQAANSSMIIRTRLKPDQVKQRLWRVTVEPLSFRHFPHNAQFDGFVEDDSFELRRRTWWYQNPFRPIIRGSVAADGEGGAVIQINMSLPRLALLMLAFASLFALFVLLATLTGSMTPGYAIHTVLFLLAYCSIPTLSFAWEARIARRCLESLLEVEPRALIEWRG